MMLCRLENEHTWHIDFSMIDRIVSLLERKSSEIKSEHFCHYYITDARKLPERFIDKIVT